MQSFGIISVLRTSLRVWQQNFVAFTLIALIIYTPALLLRFVLPEWDWALIMIPFGTVLNTMIAAAVTYGVIMELHGTRPSHAQCIKRGFAHLVPALGASVLSLLAIFGGLLLLVVPGLIVMLMLWVVVPVAVTEKPGVMASLRRSRELTHGHKGSLFVILLLLWAGSYSLDHAAADTFEPSVYAFVTIGVEAVLGLLSAVTAAVAYTQLRNLKEGTELPQIAQAFAVVRT